MELEKIEELITKKITYNNKEIDKWVKLIYLRSIDMDDFSRKFDEIVGDIQHNYELIQELMKQVKFLKSEITTLKYVQMIQLKDRGIDVDKNQ